MATGVVTVIVPGTVLSRDMIVIPDIRGAEIAVIPAGLAGVTAMTVEFHHAELPVTIPASILSQA
jgi:hypothetical protein